MVLFIVLVVIGLGIGAYIGSVLWIKKVGISVKPKNVYSPPPVRIFLQNDPKWKKDKLGSSDFSLGKSGCLVTVLAVAIDHLGVEMNPGDLNNIFDEKGVYTNNGEVIWYKIKEAVPQVDYHYQRVFNRITLENDLKKGRLPIVQVKYHKTGIFHWVLIVGTDENDFLIMDPLQQDKKLISLSTHGRVYAYRVLIKNKLQ